MHRLYEPLCVSFFLCAELGGTVSSMIQTVKERFCAFYTVKLILRPQIAQLIKRGARVFINRQEANGVISIS